MASYNIDLAYNAGDFTPTLRRGGTPASGGSTIPIKWVENNNGYPPTNADTKLFSAAVMAAWLALRNDWANNGGTPAYQITLTDTAGVYAPVLRKGGTPSSGGVVVPIKWAENNNGYPPANTSTKLLSSAYILAFGAALNDRVANP